MKSNKLLLYIALSVLVLPIISALDWSNQLDYYWNFNESSGSNLSELKSNLYGSMTGNEVWTSGKIGNSFYFDGSTYFTLSRSSEPLMTSNSNKTFSFWYASNYTGNTMIIMSDDGNSGVYMYLPANKVGIYSVVGGDYEVSTVSLPANASDNNFHHVVIVRAGTGYNKVYFDGGNMVLEADNPRTDLNTGTFVIGRRPTGLNFYGKLDELAVFNRTLNETEILELYNNHNGLEYSLSSPEPIPEPTNLYVILNNPTNNQYINTTNSITFNCSGYDSAVLNLTLYINDIENITVTNSTDNQSLIGLETTYTLTNGNYNFTCIANKFNSTNSSSRNFIVNYTIPTTPTPQASGCSSISDNSGICSILEVLGIGLSIILSAITTPLIIIILVIGIGGFIVILTGKSIPELIFDFLSKK